MSTGARTLAEVLAGHRWNWRSFQGRAVLVCACGDELIPATSSSVAGMDEHEIHLADVITAWLGEVSPHDSTDQDGTTWVRLPLAGPRGVSGGAGGESGAGVDPSATEAAGDAETVAEYEAYLTEVAVAYDRVLQIPRAAFGRAFDEAVFGIDHPHERGAE